MLYFNLLPSDFVDYGSGSLGHTLENFAHSVCRDQGGKNDGKLYLISNLLFGIAVLK